MSQLEEKSKFDRSSISRVTFVAKRNRGALAKSLIFNSFGSWLNCPVPREVRWRPCRVAGQFAPQVMYLFDIAAHQHADAGCG
jgi:hypothetical protein